MSVILYQYPGSSGVPSVSPPCLKIFMALRYVDKVMLIDDAAATIGTANFDNRSFRLNFEITAVLSDPEFVSRVERMFEDDFVKSRKVQQDKYADKSFWLRLVVRLARLTSPLL